ncbi:MAG: hypothetical protein JWR52_3107 [Marmoricola sp.]|nr:hypothetical protein [Marmoricola sp.]
MDTTPLLTDLLRAELCAFVAAAGTRRVLPVRIHLGTPGGSRLAIPHDPSYDAGLRADLTERMLDGLDSADLRCGWITRSGPLEPGDAEFGWSAAAREAFARHALDYPGFFLITRHGWRDLETGAAVHWQPPRVRWRAA